jgi:hypothetical protein
VQEEGTAVVLTSNGTGRKFDWAKPSTTVAGEVACSAGWADGPLIGRFLTGDDGGAASIELRR